MSTWYEILGAICFGSVIGWTAHYVLYRTARISIGSIVSFTAAVGGGGVLRAFGSQFPFLAVYCIGLAGAFFGRAFFTQETILKRIVGGTMVGAANKEEMNDEAWDLLATLWKFQKQCFPGDAGRRWQLALSPLSADFADFASGFARAKKLGYIDIEHASWLVHLSGTGYQFCQQYEKKLSKRKRLFYIEQ